MNFHGPRKSGTRMPKVDKVPSIKKSLSKSDNLIKRSDLSLLVEPDPPFWTKTSWLQLGYGIWVNLTLMNIGFCLEFAAVAIPQLKEEGSGIIMTKNQEATIASIVTLSSPIGCILAGILLDKCGRKAGLMWCQVPIAIGWFYTAYASYASGIIFGRVISGIGIGMAMAAPRAYVTEITLPNMRGVIGALPNLAISCGLTIQAILGTFFNWRLLCIICGSYALILLCANKFLPDTPYFILLHSTASAARVVLKRFRSSKFNVEGELQDMEDFRVANNIRSLTASETVKALCKPSACKPFSIIMAYMIFMQFSGINILNAWAVDILQIANSSIDPHVGNVVLTGTRIVFGVVTAFLLFRVARRPLALVSAAGVGGIAIMFGGYLHTHEGGRSPLAMLVAFVAFAVPGYHTLPTLMMFEMFPLQVRGILSGIVLSSANILMFTAVLIFPTMRDTLGLANTFITYGTVSLFATLVLYFILPETKDLTLYEIEEYFNKRRPTLFPERKVLSGQMRSQMLSAMSNKDSKHDYEQSAKDKNKKGKRLQITSSHEVKEGKRKPAYRKEKKISDLSFDDIVIVYDEDAVDEIQSKKKSKVDNDTKENVNIEKNKERDLDSKEIKTEKDKTDNVNAKVDEGDKKDKKKMNNLDREDVNKPSTSKK